MTDKHILKDSHFDDVDWARQRVMINERIDALEKRKPTALRWAMAAATAMAIAALAWFGMHRTIQPGLVATDVAQIEQTADEIIDDYIPSALVALNGWTDVDTTSWQTMPVTYDPFDGADTDDGQKEAL